MTGLTDTERAELHRLQQQVYGRGAAPAADGLEPDQAAERLTELMSRHAVDPPVRRGAISADAALISDASRPSAATSPERQPRASLFSELGAVLAGRRRFSRAEAVVWAAVGALVVLVLTVAGFFAGALLAPHPDRVLSPILEAESGTADHTALLDYREYTVDGFTIATGTRDPAAEGATDFGIMNPRCLYISGPWVDLRTGSLTVNCASMSAFGTTWQVSGELGGGSVMFGLGADDTIRFIERGNQIEVWLSREAS